MAPAEVASMARMTRSYSSRALAIDSRVYISVLRVDSAEQELDGIERQTRVPGERGPGCSMAKRLAPRRGAGWLS